MALHAVNDLDEAIRTTRSFLTPISVRRWLKLAVVVFFIGSGTGFPTSGVNSSSSVPADEIPLSEFPPAGIPTDLSGDLVPIVAAIALAVLLVWLVFGVIGAIMEFIFVESLRSETVRLRAYWHTNWRAGLRLFVFRVIIGLPVLALLLGILALVMLPLLTGVGSPVVPIAAIVVTIPLLIVLGILVGLINGFTTEFVVPIMLIEDCGILAGWGHLWSSIKTDWQQYLGYAFISFVLTIAAGLVGTFALGVIALILLIPLGGLGLAVFVTLSLSSPIGVAIIAVLALIFGLAMLVCWALVQVPIKTYLRYYALLVLGDIEPSFDAIPDQRAQARP